MFDRRQSPKVKLTEFIEKLQSNLNHFPDADIWLEKGYYDRIFIGDLYNMKIENIIHLPENWWYQRMNKL